MDIFAKLKSLCIDINSIYASMYTLERLDRKNNILFEEKIELLKTKVKEEDSLIKELVQCIDYDEIRKEIFECDDTDAELIRIKDYLVFYESTNIEIFDEDDEEIVGMKKMSMNVGKIYGLTAKNLFLVFSSFLQNIIDNEANEELRLRLLKLKYYNCLVKHKLEESMIAFNFNIPNEYYVDLDLVVGILKVDDVFADKIILDSYVTSIVNAIEQVLSKSDMEYSGMNMLSLKLNYLCILKACFALMNEYQYQSICDLICDKIKTYGNYDNLDSVKEIVDIINQRKIYRGKVKRLSLKPLK